MAPRKPKRTSRKQKPSSASPYYNRALLGQLFTDHLDRRHPQPFLRTKLGGLAPEIRVLIYENLLASPPPYAGREFRAAQTPGAGQSPRSLTTFVDIKASCFAILETCRQVYREAFPLFYANKSYYIANAQDFCTIIENGRSLRYFPQLFRLFQLNTITSLCIKNLVVSRAKWSPEQIERLVSLTHGFDREQLQAEQIEEIEDKVIVLDLAELKGLQTICICMRVGQEREYLRFLFNIRGLGRGVIDFVDDFRWKIRSQSMSASEWKFQYAPFSFFFYRKGKNNEPLDYEDVRIQEEVVDIDSRASDLNEGDERWVEIEVGARNYDERIPSPSAHVPQVQEVGDEDSDWVPGLDGLADSEADDVQIQTQSDQESEDLQVQEDGQSLDATADDEPDQGSNYSQNSADIDDYDTHAEPDQGSNYPQILADIDEHDTGTGLDEAASTSVTVSDEEHIGAPTGTLQNDLTATEPDDETSGSPELVDDEDSDGSAIEFTNGSYQEQHILETSVKGRTHRPASKFLSSARREPLPEILVPPNPYTEEEMDYYEKLQESSISGELEQKQKSQHENRSPSPPLGQVNERPVETLSPAKTSVTPADEKSTTASQDLPRFFVLFVLAGVSLFLLLLLLLQEDRTLGLQIWLGLPV